MPQHMEVLLLGTAAAEGWPCPWCGCAACVEARRRGGRDIRTRSGALIDDVVKVDFGPDTLMQMQREGRDLTRLSTLVFTHGHDDHFAPAELQYRAPGFVTQTPLPTLNVYANADVHDQIEQHYGPQLDAMHQALHPALEPFQAVTAPDGTEVLPLPATHGAPGSLVLRLTRQGRHIFYGHDTGTFPDDTVQALSGTPLDLALFDCTYGPTSHTYSGHLGNDGVLEMADRLRAVGAVTNQTILVATHFSHNGGLLYDGLVEAFAPRGFRVAHDGMKIDL